VQIIFQGVQFNLAFEPERNPDAKFSISGCLISHFDKLVAKR
jgi:hypothetical protein